MYKSLSLVLTFFFVFLLPAHNKIIYLVAPPRTLSTVFLRAMHARGDMAIYNEPCEYCFLACHKPDELEIYSDTLPFKTNKAIKHELYRAQKNQYVFAKDTPYAVYECFYEDDAFLADPTVEFFFLVRTPHDSLVSFHKVIEGVSLSGFDWITEWRVYERQYALFQKIKRLRGKAPMVISAEALTHNPKKNMMQLCQQMGVAFKESMVSWPSLKNNFNPLEWHDYARIEVCNIWHKHAIESTHFIPCERYYDRDEHGNPTFIEIVVSQREAVKEIYQYYMLFYKELLRMVD